MNNFYKTKKQITSWLNKYQIFNYQIVPDEKYGFVVNVEGDVHLNNKKLEFIPVKFNNVSYDFNCAHNKILSLEFCPIKINANFDCGDNRLSSLEFSPTTVKGHFDCDSNQLTNLQYCPEVVNGSFNCAHNKLVSLEFCPSKVSNSFYCNGNPQLGSIQKIKDFKEILKEHLKIQSMIDFNNKLSSDLNYSLKGKDKLKI